MGYEGLKKNGGLGFSNSVDSLLFSKGGNTKNTKLKYLGHAICNSKINLYVGTGTHACMNAWHIYGAYVHELSKCLGRSEYNIGCWSLSFAICMTGPFLSFTAYTSQLSYSVSFPGSFCFHISHPTYFHRSMRIQTSVQLFSLLSFVLLVTSQLRSKCLQELYPTEPPPPPRLWCL